MRKHVVIAALTATIATCLISADSVATPVATEQEVQDWGVAPIENAKRENLHSPTPTSIPGGKTILASELHDWLQSADKPILIDVLGGDISGRRGLPGALYMESAIGAGRIGIEMRDRFRAALDKLTGGDKSKPLVFYCLNSQCWLSYNASRRAIVAGYTNVYWYRGGIEAWKELRYPGEQARGLLQW
jgi:PQQ-dependent catabolism-associated CXXCW motif protein